MRHFGDIISFSMCLVVSITYGLNVLAAIFTGRLYQETYSPPIVFRQAPMRFLRGLLFSLVMLAMFLAGCFKFGPLLMQR